MKIILLILGGILLAVSMPQIWLFQEERIASAKAYSTYSFTGSFYGDTPIEWKGNKVTVSDSVKLQDEELRGRAYGPIEVTVNGQNLSVDAAIGVKVHASGLSRYHGSAEAAVMRELSTGEETLFFLQSLGRAEHIDESKYRIIKITQNQEVRVEEFEYVDRHEPIYRLMLMRKAYMTSEGFKNNSHSYYPPMIFPFILAPIGFLLVGIAALLALKQLVRSRRSYQLLSRSALQSR